MSPLTALATPFVRTGHPTAQWHISAQGCSAYKIGVGTHPKKLANLKQNTKKMRKHRCHEFPPHYTPVYSPKNYARPTSKLFSVIDVQRFDIYVINAQMFQIYDLFERISTSDKRTCA